MIIQPIATNIITGFLGVGKTTFIKRLLADKAAGEVWAVLVNEFGEVGIDSALLGGDKKEVQIREVAGGCMCCAAGVPMQVAINQLISKAKPDRLLIEPTGLGHPREVLKVLSEPHYQHVIKLNATLCLVDARKISDARYRDHEIFNQQLEIADIILATKTDLYSEASFTDLKEYLADDNGRLGQSKSQSLSPMSQINNESVSSDLLSQLNKPAVLPLLRLNKTSLLTSSTSVFDQTFNADEIEFDDRGIAKKANEIQGVYSCGWVFDPSYEFSFDKLIAWVKSESVLRLKAVVISDEGIAGINVIEGEMSIVELDDAMDSRIELISLSRIDEVLIEQSLLSFARKLGG